MVAHYDDDRLKSSRDTMNMSEGLEKQYKTVEENNDEEIEMAWDDVSGVGPNPGSVKKAGQEESQYVRK